MGNETTSRRGGSQPRFTTEKAFLTLRQRELLVADATRLSLPVQEVIRRIIDQHYDENVVARISRIEKRLDQMGTVVSIEAPKIVVPPGGA